MREAGVARALSRKIVVDSLLASWLIFLFDVFEYFVRADCPVSRIQQLGHDVVQSGVLVRNEVVQIAVDDGAIL